MPKSPPAYDYYNPSTWLVAPEDVEEEEDTSIAAQNARAEAAAELTLLQPSKRLKQMTYSPSLQ